MFTLSLMLFCWPIVWKISDVRHTGIWNRSGSLLDVSWVYMAMLFKDDKFRNTADNRSEHLSYVRKCNKRGVSTISNRYSKANNKYLSDYDSTQLSSYIMSWDVVN